MAIIPPPKRFIKFSGLLAPLNEIPEPPEQLYIEGKLPPEGTILLAVIGSRKFTTYGRDACEKLVAGLVGYPISVISGLAIGMDTLAHKAAIAAGLHTISFPGSGLDRSVIHPHSNRVLADNIIEHGGALISEYDPLMPAGVHTFPRRNRLMAGLAKAVLVIEAGQKSGTRITAKLATDYNRDVLAVPGSIFSHNSSGTNELIKLGATPVTGSEDVLRALGFEVSGDQKTFDFSDLTENEKLIVQLLEHEPLPRDEVVRESGLEVSEVNTALATLEIKGIIGEALGELRLK